MSQNLPCQSDIIFSYATRKDIDCLVEFNLIEAKESIGKILDPIIVRSGIESCLRDERDFYVLVKHTDECIGQVKIHRHWYDWYNTFFWWIEHLYLVKNFRKKGIGKLILNHVIKLARKEGNVENLLLHVDGDKKNLIRFYEQCGFSLHINRAMINILR